MKNDTKDFQEPTFNQLDPVFKRIYDRVKDYTLTSGHRLYSLYNAVRYLDEQKIRGDFVECGVYKGGSSMLMALTTNYPNRKIWLYDTFEGMTEPCKYDVDLEGQKASEHMDEEWIQCIAPLDEVKRNMAKTTYPHNLLKFIQGDVAQTLYDEVPGKIALLRLDTDFYESTKVELEQLFPRLIFGGVLIIDDYGHWKGSKKAVDEYFRKNNIKMLLHPMDYSGRIGLKI